MKQSTIIVLVVLIALAIGLAVLGGRYGGPWGMHGYFNDWGPGHMWSDKDDWGPRHMWDDSSYQPSHMMDDAFMGRWHDEYESTAKEFKNVLESKVVTEIGQPIEGFEPQMLMRAYPGLEQRDFDGVEAMIGHYEYVNGELIHDLEEAPMVHSAAQALTDESYEQLLFNLAHRLDMHPMDVEIKAVLSAIGEESDTDTDTPDAPEPPTPPVPDDGNVTVCTDEMKQAEVCTMEYAPVCGLVEVQCITEPCDPVPETFSNGCVACSQGNVVSYTSGACEQ